MAGPSSGTVAGGAKPPVELTADQMKKLRADLDVVNNNMRVLREMISELVPNQEPQDDYQLFVELHQTCRAMQRRLVRLLQSIANEEVTSNCLQSL